MARKRFLEAGRIVATQGLRGEVRVQPWCDGPDFLLQFKGFYFDQGETFQDIVDAHAQKNIAILHFAEVDTVEEAMKLIGKVLFINREEVTLPKGSYFEQDLLGLSVVDVNTEKVYGKLTEVMRTGANDVYAVRDEKGKEVLIPAIPDVVKNVDLAKEIMHITPLKGLFDHAD